MTAVGLLATIVIILYIVAVCAAQDVKVATAYLKTRDNVALRTIYYYSPSFESAPVSTVLMRTPYNIDTAAIRNIATIVVAAYKFVLVTQDFRGRCVFSQIKNNYSHACVI